MTLIRPGELTHELPTSSASPRALYEMDLASEAGAEEAGGLLDCLTATDEKEREQTTEAAR